MVDYKEIGAYAEGCFRDTPPPCSAACPLGVDVRGLVSKVKAGRSGAAFRAYRDAVLFPHIVSQLCDAPCAEVCVRAVQAERGGRVCHGDGSSGTHDVPGGSSLSVTSGVNLQSKSSAVNLRLIEQGVCAAEEKRPPARYAIPKKAERIAVVGGGPSGLACAQRLVSKGYTVTLYEAAAVVGGSVRGKLDEESLAEDFAVVLGLPEFDLRCGVTVALGEIAGDCSFLSCTDAGQKGAIPLVAADCGETGKADFEAIVSQNDAVYIATGAGGEDFGLKGGWDARTLATQRVGVFLGGSLAGDGSFSPCAIAADDTNKTFSCVMGVASSIENGLRAAAAMEEFLLTGRTDGNAVLFDRGSADPHYYDLTYDWDAFSASASGAKEEHSGTGSLLSEREQLTAAAAEEAARCPECNCSACIDACTMIRWFRQNPKRIAADLEVTLLPVEGKIKHVASRMLNSCNLCGLCESVCPAGVDTGAAIAEARRLMRQRGNIPAAFHDYWLEDMAFSLSEEAYAVVLPETKETKGDGSFVFRGRQMNRPLLSPLLSPASVVFFPGCQLTASLPETVVSTYEYLRGAEPGAAMILSCCGVPADWAGEQDVLDEAIARVRADWEAIGRPPFLFACATCKKTFEKYLPEAEGRLIYEWLADRCRIPCEIPRKTPLFCAKNTTFSTPEGFEGADIANVAAVYDPCAARHDEAGRRAVRSLAASLGLALREDLPLNGEHAACCGFGGHIYPANPGLLGAIIGEHAGETPMITYCANCRDLFLSKGYEAVHILELLFGDTPEVCQENRPCDMLSGAPRRLPTLTERRENRRRVKERLRRDPAVVTLDLTRNPGDDIHGSRIESGMTDEPEITDESGMTPPPMIPPSLEAKMDRLLLLRDDVYEAIAYCEETGEKFIDPDNGHFIGCRAGRVHTVWVAYAVLEANTIADVQESAGRDEAADGGGVTSIHEGARGHAAADTAGTAITLHNVYTHRMRVESQSGSASYHGPDGESGERTGQGRQKQFDADRDGFVTKLLCEKCGEPLVLTETKFSYLGHDFTHKVPRCPSCGLAYISEDLAAGKIAEVETLLEDK